MKPSTLVASLVVVLAALGVALPATGDDVAPPPRAKQPAIAKVPGVQPAAVVNPNQVAQLVDQFTADLVGKAVAAADTPEKKELARLLAYEAVSYLRFISWHAVPVSLPPRPADKFPGRPNFFRESRAAGELWFNQQHFSQRPVRFQDVPGSNGIVRVFDLREAGWSAVAWSAVARRDLTFREPTVETTVANRLRLQAGLAQDPKTLAVEVVVWGPQLFRDTVEGQRSPSYYDLTYSEFRFLESERAGPPPIHGPPKPVTRTVTRFRDEVRKERKEFNWPGGLYTFKDDSGRSPRQMAAGFYFVELEFKKKVEYTEEVTVDAEPVPDPAPLARRKDVKFVDFPNKAEFEAVFRARQEKGGARAFGKRTELRYLAVVPGMRENPKKGSPVVFHNRLLEFATGTGDGPYLESYDTDNGTGEEDYFQQAKEIARGKCPAFTAQELLGAFPDGGQAAGLFDAKGKRIEFAATTIARGILPKPGLENIYDPAVRTPGDCVRCHGLSHGVIDPQDMIREFVLDQDGKGVIDVNYRDPADLAKFEGQFQELKERNEAWRVGYKKLLRDATRGEFQKPWTGAEWVEAFEHLWNWYETPVQLQQAAFELGVPPNVVRQFKDESFSGKAKLVANDVPISRTIWDKDIRPEFWRFIVENRQQRFPAPPGFPVQEVLKGWKP